MKKIKLFQSISLIDSILNLNLINFNIAAGADLKTNIKAPALLYIHETYGSHAALIDMNKYSASSYSTVIHSKATGSIGIGVSATLLKIYVDVDNYIHLQNVSTRPAYGKIRIMSA